MSGLARLTRLAERAVEWIRGRAPSVEAEVYVSQARSRGVELREGRLESLQESAEEGIGLRLLSGGRVAFAYAAGLSHLGWPALFRRAVRQLPLVEPDRHRVLPEASRRRPDPEPEGLYDPSLFRRPLRDWVPRLRDMEARALGRDRRVQSALRLGYSENSGKVAIVSTRGVLAAQRGTSCGMGLTVIAEDGHEVQAGSAYRCARLGRDLEPERAADEAVARAAGLLGARRLRSRRRSVLFDPWVAGELLELLAGALSAEAIHRGRSLLQGKRGRRIASRAVTLVDDPLLPRGISSARYDDEGVPTERKIMVERGILRNCFYDARAAHREGRRSNGCAARAGFRSLPGAGASNFYMKPGPETRERLISGTRDGLLVREIMGMHTADPVSGAISVGVSGAAVRNGEITHGVRGAMLSGELLNMLGRVDAVADDLVFYGSLAAPTFRVAETTVA